MACLQSAGTPRASYHGRQALHRLTHIPSPGLEESQCRLLSRAQFYHCSSPRLSASLQALTYSSSLCKVSCLPHQTGRHHQLLLPLCPQHMGLCTASDRYPVHTSEEMINVHRCSSPLTSSPQPGSSLGRSTGMLVFDLCPELFLHISWCAIIKIRLHVQKRGSSMR